MPEAMRFALMLSVGVFLGACSGPIGAGPNGAPALISQPRAVRPDNFSLHPKRIVFDSPSGHLKYEYVHGFSKRGSIAENCISKGVAEVGGDGVHHGTLIAVVIPMKVGHCTATFTNGRGEQLKLPVTVR